MKINNLCKSYGGVSVIKNLSVNFPDKGFIGISGVSGVGKTTFLNIIASLEQSDSGSIEGLQHKKIAYLFADNRLLPQLTAEKNVEIVNPNKAEDILKEVGLGEAMKLYPNELSAGMKKRVAIARAIVFDGDIVLLDEPFNGLDKETQKKIEQVIINYCSEKLVLLVTHDNEVMERLCPKIYKLSEMQS